MNYNLEELCKEITNNEFKDGDQIYCSEFPNLIFIFENGEFISYYNEGHDLYGDGPLMELLKEDGKYIFSNEPFIDSLKEKMD